MPVRYAIAIAGAHAVFRVLAEAGVVHTDSRGRIKQGPA